MNRDDRPYDVILLGASGFTGKLVAEYLLKTYGSGGALSWALAGRNQTKLEAVRRDLQGPEAEAAIPILVADTDEPERLHELAASTRVICTTVGPYSLHGSSVVEACVRNGTDYCDLAGELQWMQRMIGRYQAEAAASGARIVHTCGFDSIPSDLGVLFLQQQMQKRHGVTARQAKYRLANAAGGISGGSLASMLNQMEEVAADPSIGDAIADPYALLPSDAPRGPDGPDQTGAIYDPDFERYTVPFVMAPVNTRVVRRTNYLLGHPWGTGFAYDEAELAPEGRGAFAAKLSAFATTAGMNALSLAPVRSLARRILPGSGEGPDAEAREAGHYEILIHGKHPEDASMDVRIRVSGDRDPGYGSTSKMLAESAVCLAQDPLDCGGGFWTPATAMGSVLLARLESNAGVTFRVESQD